MVPVSRAMVQILSCYHGRETTVNVKLNGFGGLINHVSLYAAPRNASCDAGFQKALDKSEWRWGINTVCSQSQKSFPKKCRPSVHTARGTLGVWRFMR